MRRRHRRVAAATAATVLALASVATAQRNVLILVADDVGVDSIPAYGEGSSLPRMPVIDGLARDGVLFRNAWGHPLCSSARAALMTGRLGVGRLTVSKILNHVDSGVTATYDRHSYDAEKRAALVRWADELDRIVKGRGKEGEVVRIA